MKKVLRYGMVGGGPGSFIGDAHRRAIALDSTAELVAGVFSSHPEKSRETAEALGLDPARCYADYREMAEKEASRPDGIDFVVVVTPNISHFEICKAFLNAGIHVSCDKPVTVTYAQAAELEQLAAEKDRLFMVTYTYTGHVTTKYARDLVASGAIGEVRAVMAEYPQGWLAHEDDHGGKQGEWRCDPARSGGVNCLGDLGTHVENIVADVTGLKIRRVLAKMDVIVPGRVLDDNDSVLVEYDNGASGIYWTSQVAIGADNSLRLRAARAPSSGSRRRRRRSPSSTTTAPSGRSTGATPPSPPRPPSTAACPPDTARAGWKPWAISTAALPSASPPRPTAPSPPT